MTMTEASVDTSAASVIALGDGVSLDLTKLIEMWLIVQANTDGGDYTKAGAHSAPALV